MKTHSFRKCTAVTALVLVMGLAGLVTSSAAWAKGGGGSGGRGGAVALPADWPAAVPIPVGAVQGSTGAAPLETVQLVVNQGYPDVVRSVSALYTSHGFVQSPDGTLVFSNAAYRVTVTGAATDHSPTRTTVVVWLQTL